MAHALGLEYCRGIYKGFYCRDQDHQVGSATPGRVHMADIHVTWPGTHRFLKLAAIAMDSSINEDVPWRRLYRANMGARQLGRALHITIPRRYLTYDRAFVRASAAGLGSDTPLRKQAHDWSRRRFRERMTS
jgi:hypothetical protein